MPRYFRKIQTVFRKRWPLRLQPMLIAFLCLNLSGAFADEPPVTIKVATDYEKEGGALVELTIAAFKRVGYNVDIQYFPWKRALEKSLAGDFDLLLGAYYTKERELLLAYSEPIGKLDLCLVKRSEDDIRFTSLEDLKPYRIGLVRGAAVRPDFDLAARTFLNIEYVSILKYNIRKLLHRRIDLFVDKRFMVQKILREEYPDSIDKVDILSPPLRSFAFYNAFPRSRPSHLQYLNAFNKGLSQLRSDGTMIDIFAQHNLEQPPDL
jgi:polar amino acid transport system substrate-binding protein